jgi:hypothetical protein
MTQRLAAVALVLATACAPQSGAVARAIAARGGPLPGLVRESAVQVALGFPGAWEWRTVWAPPERYAWSIVTNDLPHHYLFDGAVVRAFIGGQLVSEGGAAAGLRTHARFVAVANLDVLRAAGVRVRATAAEGGGTMLDVAFADRGERYRVTLDGDDLVRRVEGPIDLTPVAQGTLVASYDDLRAVAGRRLPHRIHYELNGQPLADEQVRRSCLLRTSPPTTAFASPTSLPRCDD